MRYSEYFIRIAALVEVGNKSMAEQLLRTAEKYALLSIVTHMVLCAKTWSQYLGNPDNAVRCLLEAECNNSDVRSLLEIAEAYIELSLHGSACKRCIKKAMAAADDEEGKMRLQEFFVKHSNCKQITEGLSDA